MPSTLANRESDWFDLATQAVAVLDKAVEVLDRIATVSEMRFNKEMEEKGYDIRV